MGANTESPGFSEYNGPGSYGEAVSPRAGIASLQIIKAAEILPIESLLVASLAQRLALARALIDVYGGFLAEHSDDAPPDLRSLSAGHDDEEFEKLTAGMATMRDGLDKVTLQQLVMERLDAQLSESPDLPPLPRVGLAFVQSAGEAAGQVEVQESNPLFARLLSNATPTERDIIFERALLFVSAEQAKFLKKLRSGITILYAADAAGIDYTQAVNCANRAISIVRNVRSGNYNASTWRQEFGNATEARNVLLFLRIVAEVPAEARLPELYATAREWVDTQEISGEDKELLVQVFNLDGQRPRTIRHLALELECQPAALERRIRRLIGLPVSDDIESEEPEPYTGENLERLQAGVEERIQRALKAGEEPTFQEQALCSDVECPDIFFSRARVMSALAKEVCRACGVRIECLAGALKDKEHFGVWGGELMDSEPPGRAQAKASSTEK